MPLETVIAVATFLGGLAAAAAGLAWFIFSQFSQTRAAFYTTISELHDKIVAKLEYHEKHDDQRFQATNDRIWGIELRNAARDGTTPPARDRNPH